MEKEEQGPKVEPSDQGQKENEIATMRKNKKVSEKLGKVW